MLVAALLGRSYLGLALLVAPAVGFALAVSIAAYIWRLDTGQAARLAAAISFGAILVVGLGGAVIVDGSGPDCDGFCMDQGTARAFVMVVALSYGGLVALLSAVLASSILGFARRNNGTG